MAIRFLKGKKSPYQVYWNNPFTGRRESSSFEQEAEAKKHDALIKYRLKFEREMFRPLEEEKSVPQKSHTLESAYYLYLKDRRFTEQSLRISVESMRQVLDALGAEPVGSINADSMTALKARMMATGIKGTTYRRRMSSLKAVFNWCVSNGIIDHAPKLPAMPRAEYERHVPPTVDEIETLLAVSPAHIQRVIILGSKFGMRVGPSEMFRLMWSDVDLTSKVIRVPAARKNINEPWRNVPIRESLMPVFKAWRDYDRKVSAQFVVHYGGKQVTTIKTAWNAALMRANITRKIWPYDLRHHFATEALAAGVDAGTVAKLMGHESTAMIFEHYQHVPDAQKRRAVEQLPEVQYVHGNMCTKKAGHCYEQ